MSDVVNSETQPPARASGIDDLVARLQARVAERRASGDYPEGLEDQLQEHFRRIVSHRSQPDNTQLVDDVKALSGHMAFTAQVPVESSAPGGAAVHRAVAKAVSRHTEAIVHQLEQFAFAVRTAIDALADAVQDPSTHIHGDLVGHLDAVIERLDAYERAPVGSAVAVADLRRRVEELEKAEQRRQSNA